MLRTTPLRPRPSTALFRQPRTTPPRTLPSRRAWNGPFSLQFTGRVAREYLGHGHGGAMHGSLREWTAQNLDNKARIPKSILDQCAAIDTRNKERSRGGGRRLAVKKNVRVQVFGQVRVGVEGWEAS